MYILKIEMPEKIEYIDIDSFAVSSSEQDLALGDAAIGGLYCTLYTSEIDKYFYLVQKQVNKITIYEIPEQESSLNENGEIIEPIALTREEILVDENIVYTSSYWSRIISLSGSYVPMAKQIVSTLRIGHMIEEDE